MRKKKIYRTFYHIWFLPKHTPPAKNPELKFSNSSDSNLIPKFIENKLKEEFKNKSTFSREELLNFFRQFEPGLSDYFFILFIYLENNIKAGAMFIVTFYAPVRWLSFGLVGYNSGTLKGFKKCLLFAKTNVYLHHKFN